MPEKVQAIQDFKKSETIKQLRHFLETINFYRRFVLKAAKDQAKLRYSIRIENERKNAHRMPLE